MKLSAKNPHLRVAAKRYLQAEMNELLELNKEDLIKNWLWIGGIMTFGFSVYYFFFHQELKTELYITVAILSIVFFPLITIGIWCYDWFRKRKYKKRILTKNPFSELEKIGFTKRIVKRNHNSLKDYVQYAEINGCEMIFDLDIKKPKIAEFQILGLTNHLSTSEFSQKLRELKSKNIDISYYCFTKTINTKKDVLNSIQELEKILTEFTHIVKKLKYQPIPITEWKNA